MFLRVNQYFEIIMRLLFFLDFYLYYTMIDLFTLQGNCINSLNSSNYLGGRKELAQIFIWIHQSKNSKTWKKSVNLSLFLYYYLFFKEVKNQLDFIVSSPNEVSCWLEMTLLVGIKDQFTQSLEKFCMFVSNLIENASKKDRGG